MLCSVEGAQKVKKRILGKGKNMKYVPLFGSEHVRVSKKRTKQAKVVARASERDEAEHRRC